MNKAKKKPTAKQEIKSKTIKTIAAKPAVLPVPTAKLLSRSEST
ncbi:MAG: hypothetical protein M5U11_17640 [Anaerolineales bacterium]|nr:hypothetical protein [Anaerolineales bacterium]HPO85018.1 hypothetical protein [Candidatus Hydrogenedentota bacterium]